MSRCGSPGCNLHPESTDRRIGSQHIAVPPRSCRGITAVRPRFERGSTEGDPLPNCRLAWSIAGVGLKKDTDFYRISCLVRYRNESKSGFASLNFFLQDLGKEKQIWRLVENSLAAGQCPNPVSNPENSKFSGIICRNSDKIQTQKFVKIPAKKKRFQRNFSNELQTSRNVLIIHEPLQSSADISECRNWTGIKVCTSYRF